MECQLMADREEVEAFLEEAFASIELPVIFKSHDADNALYTMNELSLWEDDVEVSLDQAIKCWQLIEYLRTNKWPEEHRM